MSRIISWNEKKGKYRLSEKFNVDHYYDVIRAKYPDPHSDDPWKEELVNHPLKGKRIVDETSNKETTIQSVWKHWYIGWYIVLLTVDNNESHGLVFWENINCVDPDIILSISKCRQNYHIPYTDSAEAKLEEWLMERDKDIFKEFKTLGGNLSIDHWLFLNHPLIYTEFFDCVASY